MSSTTKPSLRITRIDGSFSGNASAAISVKSRTSKPLRRHTQHDLDRIPEQRSREDETLRVHRRPFPWRRLFGRRA